MRAEICYLLLSCMYCISVQDFFNQVFLFECPTPFLTKCWICLVFKDSSNLNHYVKCKQQIWKRFSQAESGTYIYIYRYISFRIASREQMAFKVMQFIYSSVLCFDLLQFDPLSSPTISNCIVSVQGFCYFFPFCLMTCPKRNQNKTKLPTESLSVDDSKKVLVEEGPRCPNAQGQPLMPKIRTQGFGNSV